jgi:hypothetical protein
LQIFIQFLRAKVVDSHPPPVVDLSFLPVIEEKSAVVESQFQWI